MFDPTNPMPAIDSILGFPATNPLTPVQEIQTAIEKLIEQRDAPRGGVWRDAGGYISTVTGGWVCGDFGNVATVALIVTLHNTIDAQLEILQDAIDFFDGSCCDDHGLRGSAPALAIARAINGVTP